MTEYMLDQLDWERHTKDLDDEDKRDSYDPVMAWYENHFFPPDQGQRRERINKYLSKPI